MNASYKAWNQVLAERFFGPTFAERPVYLAVDDEVLAELSSHVGADAETAAESLAGAIRREFESTSHYGLYRRFFRSTREWRKRGIGDEPPPYIALLGLAVLAGSRMARDPETRIASSNFYAQYNELIGLEKGAGQPPGFDELGALWEDLDRWLDKDRGMRWGRSTVRKHPTLSHVGYPISQCLLREVDRRRLTAFFRAVGLEPLDEITADELITYLRNWVHPGCGLSKPAIRVLGQASSAVADDLASVVKSEFDNWTGELLDVQGRRRSEIALTLQIKQGGNLIRPEFWPRQPDGFPPTLGARVSSGESIELREVASGWYGPLTAKVGDKELRDGFSLESDKYSLSYSPSLVVPFRTSDEIGRWVSVSQVRAVEPHCVLAHISVVDDVRHFLAKHAEAGWRELPDSGDIPGNWRVFRQIKVSSPAAPPQDHLRCLAPRFGTASSFEGGLKIRKEQYLKGGEPDLWITVAKGDAPRVEIDGYPVDLDGEIVRIRLSERNLPAGEHTIRIGGLTRRFASFEGFKTTSPSGTGSLGHILKQGAGYLPSSAGAQPLNESQAGGTVYVSGASAIAAQGVSLPEAVIPPILLPAGFDSYTLLGRVPGEVLDTTDPGPPDWLEALGLGNQYQFFDQIVPFEVQWLIAKGRREAQITAVRNPPAMPAEHSLPDQSNVARWCDLVDEAVTYFRYRTDYEDALEKYLERASEYRAGK